MSKMKKEAFHVIGLAIRTTNDAGQAGTDIPNLWGKFMGEQVSANIPNKVGEEVYCIYTNYEGDHTKPYTTLLGCKVSSLTDIPEGMKGMTFNAANYETFTAKGDLTKGVVWNKWVDIWDAGLDRTFIADFEVYGEKAMNPQDGEVDFYVGVR